MRHIKNIFLFYKMQHEKVYCFGIFQREECVYWINKMQRQNNHNKMVATIQFLKINNFNIAFSMESLLKGQVHFSPMISAINRQKLYTSLLNKKFIYHTAWLKNNKKCTPEANSFNINLTKKCPETYLICSIDSNVTLKSKSDLTCKLSTMKESKCKIIYPNTYCKTLNKK